MNQEIFTHLSMTKQYVSRWHFLGIPIQWFERLIWDAYEFCFLSFPASLNVSEVREVKVLLVWASCSSTAEESDEPAGDRVNGLIVRELDGSADEMTSEFVMIEPDGTGLRWICSWLCRRRYLAITCSLGCWMVWDGLVLGWFAVVDHQVG